MTTQNYKPFVDRMIQRYEGGYGWDKGDPGGPTKYGITCYDLAEYLGEHMTSMSSWAPRVKAMSLDTAEAIYVKKYASYVRFYDLPSGVDCVMFDYAVNSGIGRPVRVARRLLNQGDGDRMTDNLMQAIKDADPKWFIDAMCKERLHFMHQIRGGAAWAEFGKGWGARVDDLERYSVHLVDATAAPESAPPPPPAPDLSKVPTPKATHAGPSAATQNKGAGTVIATGAGAAAAGVPVWIVVGVVVAVVFGIMAVVLWRRAEARAQNDHVELPPNIPPQLIRRKDTSNVPLNRVA